MRTWHFRCLRAAIIVSLAMALPAGMAPGQSVTYFDTDFGDWQWSVNWSHGVPDMMTGGVIGSTYEPVATATLTRPGETCSYLYLGDYPGSSGTLWIQYGGDLTSYGLVHVGDDGYGRVLHDDGSFWAYGDGVVIARGSESHGEYHMRSPDAYLSASMGIVVGQDGSGLFRQVHGTTEVMGNLILGQNTGSTGSYVLSGGSVELFEDSDTIVGADGTGTFEQTGGWHATDSLYIGHLYDWLKEGRGTYKLAGGALTTQHNVVIGYPSPGEFIQTGGQAIVGDSLLMGIGDSNAVASYELRSGALDVTDRTVVGETADATFIQSGGTHNTNTLYVSLKVVEPWDPNSKGVGTYELRGGDLNSGDVRIRDYNVGLIRQTGGRHEVTNDIMISGGDGSEGTYELTGGELVVGGQICKGEGTSRLYVDGGTLSVIGTIEVEYFEAGYASGSNGSFAVEEGKSLLTGATCVGRGGTGTMAVLGYHRVAGSLTVGFDGPGHAARYRLYETGVLSAGSIHVGYDGSDASFAWYGGALEVGMFSVYPSGTLQMGFDFALDELLDGSLFHGGTGSLNGLNGATLCISNAARATQDATATLGHLALGYLTSAGSYELSGGALHVDDVTVGGSSADSELHVCGTGVATITGALTIHAGRVRVSGTSGIDAGSIVSDDRLDVEGGIVAAPTFAASSGAETTVSGGSLWVASVMNAGQFTQTGGAVSGAGGSSRGTFDNYGTLRLSGGTFDDDLNNHGTLIYEGGTFTGELVHYGTLMQTAGLTTPQDVTNHGTMGLGGNCDLTANGPTGVTNHGRLQLSGGSLGGTAVVNEHGGLIGGEGTIASELTNRGTVEPDGRLALSADSENAGTVTIGPGCELSVGGTSGLDNRGLISVNDGLLSGGRPVNNGFGGRIEMTGTASATADIFNDGVLHVHNAAAVNITRISSNAGELLVEDGRAYVGIMHGMTGAVTVENATLTIEALAASVGRTFVRDGALNFGAMPNQMGLLEVDDGTVTFGESWGNYGTTALSNRAQLVGEVCTNYGTLSGSGTVGCAVRNHGEVRAEGGSLVLAFGGCTNELGGRIEATAGSSATVVQGLPVNNGQIVLSGGGFSNGGHTITNNGSIVGHGAFRSGGLTNNAYVGVGNGSMEVIGNVTNNGTVYVEAGDTAIFYGDVSGSGSFEGAGTTKFLGAVKPGSSPGIMSFEGDVVLAGPSTLEVELADPDNSDPLAPRYDALAIDGDVSLAGSLSLGWLPVPGDPTSKFGGVYTILSYEGTRTGAFDGIDCQMAAYLDTSVFPDGIEYDDVNGEIKVHLYGLLDGDADLDGTVAREDLHALQAGFGSPEPGWFDGDFNFDGRVDFLDYLTWKANVGDSVPGAVPEPAALALLAIGGPLALLRRRRTWSG
ncbi:MAG: PEP-CTERM sorting domain-containing protein [Phycisphaerae bacterium]